MSQWLYLKKSERLTELSTSRKLRGVTGIKFRALRCDFQIRDMALQLLLNRRGGLMRINQSIKSISLRLSVASCFFFPALSLAADCTPLMIHAANPWKRGDPVCTVSQTDTRAKGAAPEKRQGMGSGMDPQRMLETSVAAPPEMFETSLNNIKAMAKFTHPMEAQLREYNQRLSQMQSLDQKMKYSQSLPTEIQSLIAGSILVQESILHRAGSNFADHLIRYRSQLRPTDYNDMALMSLSWSHLDKSPQKMERSRKLLEGMRELDADDRGSYCNMTWMLQGAAKSNLPKEHIQLLAEAFSLQKEPSEKCPQSPFAPEASRSREQIFEDLHEKGILTGKEPFLSQVDSISQKKVEPLVLSNSTGESSDYKACRMNELEDQIEMELNAYQSGKRKTEASFLKSTSVNCSVQIYGVEKDGKFDVQINIWNSKGERVVKSRGKFANKDDIKKILRGPYTPVVPRGLVVITPAAPTGNKVQSAR